MPTVKSKDYDVIKRWLYETSKSKLMTKEEEQDYSIKINEYRLQLISCLILINPVHELIIKTINSNKVNLQKYGFDLEVLFDFPNKLKDLRINFPNINLENLNEKQLELINKSREIITYHDFYRELDLFKCVNIANDINKDIQEILSSKFSKDNKSRKINIYLKENVGLRQNQWNAIYNQTKTIFPKIIEIRNKFVESNLRLVVNIAKKFKNFVSFTKFSDLIQEGNDAIIHCCLKFNHTLGFRFSTYATFWIRHYIGRFIEMKESEIRIPSSRLHKVKKINKAKFDLSVIQSDIHDYPKLSKMTGLSQSKIKELEKYSHQFISLNEIVEDFESENEFQEIFKDETTPDPFKFHYEKEMRENMFSVMEKHLNPRQIEIIKHRYGFDKEGNSEMITLEELGKKFGITRERIRQLEMKSMKILRHPLVSKKIQSYVS